MRKTRKVKLNLFTLENRLTPSVTAKFTAGSLNITGDDAANTIFIAHHGATTDVYVVNDYIASAAGQTVAYQVCLASVGNGLFSGLG